MPALGCLLPADGGGGYGGQGGGYGGQGGGYGGQGGGYGGQGGGYGGGGWSRLLRINNVKILDF